MVDIHSMLPKSAPTTTRGQRSLDKQLEQAKLTTRDDFWVRYYDELTSNGYQIPLDRFPKKYQDCSVMRQIKSRPEPPRYYPASHLQIFLPPEWLIPQIAIYGCPP